MQKSTNARTCHEDGSQYGSIPSESFNIGSVVEWSMALVLKTSVSKGTVSSNLTASANLFLAGVVVAQESPKLLVAVRFRSEMPIV